MMEGNNTIGKYLGTIQYENITLQTGLPLPKAIANWVTDFWQKESLPPNGAILAVETAL